MVRTCVAVMMLSWSNLVVAAAEAPGVTKVAVLEIKSSGIDEVVTKNLSELFTAEAGKVPGYKIIAHQEIQDMLGFEIQKQTLGCDEASCFAEIGGALGVDLIVSGSIGKVGETFIVSLRLIDIKKNETKNRVGESIAGRIELLPDYVRVLAWQLFGAAAPEQVLAAYQSTKSRLEGAVASNNTASGTVVAAPVETTKVEKAKEPRRTAAAPVPAQGEAPRPWTWQRVAKSVSGLVAVAGLFGGATSHVVAYLKDNDQSAAEDIPGFGAPADDLRTRAYGFYGVGLLGIAGVVVFSILEPDPQATPVVQPTPTGVAFAF